jgi:hypothetical protein
MPASRFCLRQIFAPQRRRASEACASAAEQPTQVPPLTIRPQASMIPSNELLISTLPPGPTADETGRTPRRPSMRMPLFLAIAAALLSATGCAVHRVQVAASLPPPAAAASPSHPIPAVPPTGSTPTSFGRRGATESAHPLRSSYRPHDDRLRPRASLDPPHVTIDRESLIDLRVSKNQDSGLHYI